MLRIHCTPLDLATLTVAPDPLWDTVLGVRQLGTRDAPAFASWRRRAGAPLADRHVALAVRTVRLRAPERAGYFPDFLTRAAGSDGPRGGLEAVERTPARRLTDDLALAFEGRSPPGRVKGLAEADRAVRANALRGGGAHGLPRSFGPPMRWRPPCSNCRTRRRDQFLKGRGLRLVPSRFRWGKQVARADP